MASKRTPKAPARKRHLTGIQPKLSSGRWYWRARIRRDGQQVVGQLRETQEKAHADYLQLRQAHYRELEDEQAGAPRLHQALDEFLERQRGRSIVAGTLRNYVRMVGYLKAAWPSPDTRLDELDKHAIEAYVPFAEGQGRKAKSIGDELRTLRRAFDLADYPFPREVKAPRIPRPERHFLEQGELLDVVCAMREWKPARTAQERELRARDRDLAVVTLLATTGIRAGELLRLRVKDIHTGRREITIQNNKNLGQREAVPYAEHVDESIQVLIGQAQPDGRLIANRHTYDAMWRRWKPRLGLDHLNGRVLRHTEGSRVLRDTGGDLAAAQQRLRHASIKTTAVYMHAEQSAVRRSLEVQSQRWAEASGRQASGASESAEEPPGDPPSGA